MQPKTIAAAILAVILVVFLLQNLASVPVRFLFWKVEMSRALLLLVVLLIGVAIGWVAAGLGSGRR